MPRIKRTDSAAAESAAVMPIWKTAIYVRLSVLDSGKNDGESIETQIMLLEQYVVSHPDLDRVALYCDNGFTGTNFERPAWEQMMANAYLGKINCIVVKDLSRLGRNYIEVGAFLDRDCPRLGLRLISVNDGYDSTSLNASEELNAALKNIVNDYYAKDISRKICSALAAKRLRGEFVSGCVPYGYQRDPENKNHLIIDPEAAAVVRRVYHLRAEGMGIGSIIRKLNNEGVPSPGRYRYEHGIITNCNKKGSALLWGRHVLGDTLKNPVYLGHLVHGRYRARLYAGVPLHTADEAEWDIVRNTHEAIIKEELFRQVQSITETRKKEYYENFNRYAELPREENPYRKHLVCADCGRPLKLIRQLANKGVKAYHSYVCPSYEETGRCACTKKSIRSYKVDHTVLQLLQKQMELFLDTSAALSELLKTHPTGKTAPSANFAGTLEKQLEHKQSLLASCYADWKSGLLSDEEYEFISEKYKKDEVLLRNQLKACEASKGKSAGRLSDRSAYWKAQIRKYRSAKTVTAEIVDAFIQEIQLHEDNSLKVRFAFDADLEALKTELSQDRVEVA